jgi:hypothetical protein
MNEERRKMESEQAAKSMNAPFSVSAFRFGCIK